MQKSITSQEKYMNKTSESILIKSNEVKLDATGNLSKYLLVEPASAVTIETNPD